MFWNKKTISLVLALLLVLIASVANADYTFGIPLNLGPTVNSSAHDDTPSISADGLELYFMSYRDRGYPYGELYVSTRISTQEPWGPPENLGDTINSPDFDGLPCISADGLELYYVSDRTDPYGCAIWMTKRVTRNDEWGEPVNLGRFFSGDIYAWAPAISSDGLELYISEINFNFEGDYQGDLWLISRPSVSDPWGQPENLGPTVNSPADDSLPSISSDGRMLFFTSNRSGGLGNRDLWVTKRATPDDDWGTPVNLGPNVNGGGYEIGPCVSADGRTLYFQSGQNRGTTNQDIWQVSIEPVVDLNGDGTVDAADMCIIVDNWDTDEPSCDIGPMPWGDGIVGVQDIIVWAEHYEPPCELVVVIDSRVSASSDDAEEALNAGYNNWNNSSDLEVVHDRIDNGGEQLIGMTFRNIDIAPGEVITNAYIEYVCDETINGTADAYFLIWGHLTPNSDGFPAPFTISNRPRTDARVPWQPDPWDAPGQTIRTVDISPIIQELIDQEGWIAGNAVEIIIGADPDMPSFTGVRCAESYDGLESAAPLLHIEIAVP
jgi:hypothetical protein